MNAIKEKNEAIKQRVINSIARIIVCITPKILANIIYKSIFHKSINWNNPTDLIEKIYWLQFYTDTSMWSTCADKYAVREYVKDKDCESNLNTIYGVWDNVNDINWGSLPSSFILKTTNGCGQVIKIDDKSKADLNSCGIILRSWMNSKYGWKGVQLHYTRIKPRIIAERLLVNNVNDKESLIDYKIWCFHGVPEFVLVVFGRTGIDDYSLSAFDMNWNNISENVFNKNDKHYSGKSINRPDSFEEMIRVAKKLSEDFVEVRVDFYDVDSKAVFGELTFSTGYGYFSHDFYKTLGNKIDLSKVKCLKKINKK